MWWKGQKGVEENTKSLSFFSKQLSNTGPLLWIRVRVRKNMFFCNRLLSQVNTWFITVKSRPGSKYRKHMSILGSHACRFIMS